jgi:hypothetical protein
MRRRLIKRSPAAAPVDKIERSNSCIEAKLGVENVNRLRITKNCFSV